MSEAVKVIVRCRPMSLKEKERGCVSVVESDTVNKQVNLIKDPKEQPKSFGFDAVFEPECSQSFIYEQSAFSLVDSVLDGYNGTIFAYGQTGCGKTHTMMGSPESQESRGIVPRTFRQIITVTKSETSKNHLIRCSFIEIYNEEIHDLLGKDIKAKLELKESPEKGVFVKDLNQLEVNSIAKMEDYMDIGFRNRAVRETDMNKESSRSHSIFTIYIDSQESDEKGNEKYRASKLNLVDLAGSERASKTGTTGEGMKEATKINLSLSALGNVISALVDGKTHHVPYRDSKLTRLLQDSLGGNTKTVMIAAVSPANYNYEETLSTLRYASRAKFIQNKPKINEDPKDALLREYMEEIKRLKMVLEGKLPTYQLTEGGENQQNKQNQQNHQNQWRLEEELKAKESQLRNEQEEKQFLKGKLTQLEKRLQKGKEPDRSSNTELDQIKKLKEKLKAQRKREEDYRRQKQLKEGELLNIERNYKNLNEEVESTKASFQQLKLKYVNVMSELADIRNEHEDSKEQLLENIREQEKEISKFSAILGVIFSADQLEMISNACEWKEDDKEWIVPTFFMKDKQIVLPKVTKDPAELEKLRKQGTKGNEKEEGINGFKVSKILRDARECQATPLNPHKLAARAQLAPLRTDSYENMRVARCKAEDDGKRKKERLDPIAELRSV